MDSRKRDAFGASATEAYFGAGCPPSETPDDIDIAALKAKYRQERDKRVRPEGQKQYLAAEDDLAPIYEDDPFMPVVPRAPLSEDIDVAVLGAGWSGTLAAYHLKQAGVGKVRVIDHAGDFGGVWYWNRFPGVQCDNEGYCYMPLLEETGFMPSQRYSDGWEIYEHFQRIARRFGLYEGALFHTLITSLRWDAGLARWRVATNRGDDIRARFVVMAGGPLNRPKLPAIPGLKAFKGHSFHTARWEYDYTGGDPKNPVLDKLRDKRVALVGTGATAIQVVPYLGRDASQLYVVQRTPSSVDDRPNPPTDPLWAKSLKPGWHKTRRANYHRGAIDGFRPGEPDLVCDFLTEINRNLQAKREARGAAELAPADQAALRDAENFRVMERLRRRIDSIVRDPQTAEALKPWYRHGCKRPCTSASYLETFNRPNVKLLDVSGTRGLERITETGIVANGVEYAVDCIIFASGFEVTSELDRRWGLDVIEGRDGVSIYDHWAEGYRTLHGMMTHGFPNQFFIGFLQGGFNATTTLTFELQAHHIAHVIEQALARGAARVEPALDAQEAWVRHIHETGVDLTEFQRECTPSYLNNEGEQKIRWYIGDTYGPGFEAFDQLLQAWRARGDLAGLNLDP